MNLWETLKVNGRWHSGWETETAAKPLRETRFFEYVGRPFIRRTWIYMCFFQHHISCRFRKWFLLSVCHGFILIVQARSTDLGIRHIVLVTKWWRTLVACLSSGGAQTISVVGIVVQNTGVMVRTRLCPCLAQVCSKTTMPT